MQPSFVASFGRRLGRTLRDSQKQRMSNALPTLSINIAEGASLSLAETFGKDVSHLHLEIGFGGGEHLAAQAATNPDICFIGCEPFLNGVVSLLSHIEAKQVQNIRIWQDDARILLEALPDHSLERVYVLFPDPWPKKKHHKRRIIATPLLSLLAKKMQQGAELRIATDHTDYAEWILEQLSDHPDFNWLAESNSDWKIPPADWIPTRYQQKAEKQGIKPFFFRFACR